MSPRRAACAAFRPRGGRSDRRIRVTIRANAAPASCSDYEPNPPAGSRRRVFLSRISWSRSISPSLIAPRGPPIPIWRSHIVINTAGVVAVPIQTSPPRMIGWINIAVAKSDRVLRGDFMMTIKRVIRVAHSIAATASHCRTRDYQRKCGRSDQSEFRHAPLPFVLETQRRERPTAGAKRGSDLGFSKIIDLAASCWRPMCWRRSVAP